GFLGLGSLFTLAFQVGHGHGVGTGIVFVFLALGLIEFGMARPQGCGQVNDIAQKAFLLLHQAEPFNQLGVAPGAAEQAIVQLVFAGLDTLGQLHFALTGQQFNVAHFAQVHAHGVVGTTVILGHGIGGLGFGILVGIAEKAGVGSQNIGF